MSMQTILPFPQWRFPKADADLLALANAFDQCDCGSYSWHQNWKRWYFYPLKTRILKEHGVPDGFDLQVIYLRCNRCVRGIWHSEFGTYSDICHHCDGSGIYRTDAVKLSRWLLAGKVFHCVEERWRNVTETHDEEGEYELAPPLFEVQQEARNCFQGVIKHGEVREYEAVSAFFLLLKKYDRATYDHILDRRVEEAVMSYRELALRPFKRLIQRAYDWLLWHQSPWAEGLREWFGIEEEDTPF